MKQCFILWVLLISLCFAGCTTELQKASAPSDAIQECVAIPTFTTIAEYEQYISAVKQGDNFISYDMLQNVGRFRTFVNYGRTEPCHNYSYGLVDDNGIEISIHVNSLPNDIDKTEKVILLEKQDDLRTASTATGVYTDGGIRYYYVDGALKRIEWLYENCLVFIVGPGNTLQTYPNNSNTITGRLLNSQTAQAAVEEFSANVAAVRQDKAAKAE